MWGGVYRFTESAHHAEKLQLEDAETNEDRSEEPLTAITVAPLYNLAEAPQASKLPSPLYLIKYKDRTVSPEVTLYVRSTEARPAFDHAQQQLAVFPEVVTFEEFLKAVEPRLKRLLTVYRIPADDAEDVLQQSLLDLLYQWERVRDPESWLFGTVRRHCLMYWRAHRRRIYSAVDSAILEWLSEPIAPSQERTDLLCDLESLIERLPTRCRSVLRLRFRLGYDPPEVARLLGYPESSIGKITTRCLAALSREMLASGLMDEFPKTNSGTSDSIE
jgi:RNA polymerase sigma factor (sigma-70 family)